MLTSTSSDTDQVGAASVRFEGDVLHVALTDGREIAVPLARVPWLRWLLRHARAAGAVVARAAGVRHPLARAGRRGRGGAPARGAAARLRAWAPPAQFIHFAQGSRGSAPPPVTRTTAVLQ
jgi:hypothetical protein